MPSVAQVFSWRVRPGRRKDFMKIAVSADKILRRLGATTRTLDSLAGGEAAGTMTYVIECPDRTGLQPCRTEWRPTPSGRRCWPR
jgi:hypothetical protein